ncbi:alpha/beta hydrolase [Candidatus Saccharibacteria bacterium]|nr:alpha/beta hydrolase [Candidatus Saccharibacteria bacterium]
MKNALILHGTSANPHANWFDWLRDELEASGYNVWVPQLPNADHPDMQTYREFIFSSDFNFNEETLIIGHSSGAVATLSLLEALQQDKKIDTAVMVGVYRPENHSYSSKEPIDVNKVKGKAKRMVFVHSDNDPYCPLEGAEYFAKTLNAELVVIPNNDHFSYELNPKHSKLPELIDILTGEIE